MSDISNMKKSDEESRRILDVDFKMLTQYRSVYFFLLYRIAHSAGLFHTEASLQ